MSPVTRAYTNQESNTQAKGDTPHLSEGVPNKISLIRLSQGRLDRWRREKVILKMITEHSCNPFADLKSESRSKEGCGSQGSPGRLMGQGRGYEGASFVFCTLYIKKINGGNSVRVYKRSKLNIY